MLPEVPLDILGRLRQIFPILFELGEKHLERKARVKSDISVETCFYYQQSQRVNVHAVWTRKMLISGKES